MTTTADTYRRRAAAAHAAAIAYRADGDTAAADQEGDRAAFLYSLAHRLDHPDTRNSLGPDVDPDPTYRYGDLT